MNEILHGAELVGLILGGALAMYAAYMLLVGVLWLLAIVVTFVVGLIVAALRALNPLAR